MAGSFHKRCHIYTLRQRKAERNKEIRVYTPLAFLHGRDIRSVAAGAVADAKDQTYAVASSQTEAKIEVGRLRSSFSIPPWYIEPGATKSFKHTIRKLRLSEFDHLFSTLATNSKMTSDIIVLTSL